MEHAKWEGAVVLTREDDVDHERIDLQVCLANGDLVKMMKRGKRDELGKTLKRLEKSLGVKGAWEVRDVNDVRCADDCLNETAFMATGSNLVHPSANIVLNIITNPARILSLELRGTPVVGCPFVPVLETEFDENVPQKWEWTDEAARVICTEKLLVPTNEITGSKVKVKCTLLGRPHSSMTAESEAHVQASPNRDVILRRQGYFSAPLPHNCEDFRLVTYNVLADAYSHSFPRMYDYCKEEHWNMDYRLPLLLKEVIDYHADLICLQEVDVKVFPTWKSCLNAEFDGEFTPKATESPQEGCAMFWRRSKFRKESFESVAFRDLIQKYEQPWLQDLIEQVPELRTTLEKVSTIAQVCVLSYVAPELPDKRVVLTNTHSFYHPGAGSVRAIQAKLTTELIKEKELHLSRDKSQVAAILCGDLNAQIQDLSVEFLLKGRVDASHSEWTTSSLFKWGSNANLARDKVFTEAEGERRYPTALLQRTKSGRMLSVDDLAEQVDRIDHTHDWSMKVNVIAELGTLLEIAQANRDRSDITRLESLLDLMQQHVMDHRVRMIAAQAQLCETSPHKDDANVTIGVGVNLEHPYSFESACGFPPATNYTRAWQGDIDWVLITADKLMTKCIAPIPEESVLSADVALPSETFPSDHVSLAADFTWRKDKEE
mmetsp:Transcript_9637/g.16938  ORF Transcript_9637/g.16938 Transcript_9637/m.16938 type:complete len:660 (-) Transcript_9637:298-2277(-)|eukprot:CAMPEP_0184524156 /NCGR_PEP_ID=MMETSP0198_2-20121128/9335_1 /TAXON_ID=1112570 /ORGANISM="Thraustochytrium sp., Strain LLF1b" /LENGTH=659 /DNA_ID=CAMNT_0026915371 /DNA_START=205 /DNA_END=2184 /DNA_ORIENTATION=+